MFGAARYRAALHAAAVRPMLKTISIALLGVVPLLLSSGVGAETQRSIATVSITFTLLPLLWLQVVCEWLEIRLCPAEKSTP